MSGQIRIIWRRIFSIGKLSLSTPFRIFFDSTRERGDDWLTHKNHSTLYWLG
jgi:hypothetical protein